MCALYGQRNKLHNAANRSCIVLATLQKNGDEIKPIFCEVSISDLAKFPEALIRFSVELQRYQRYINLSISAVKFPRVRKSLET